MSPDERDDSPQYSVVVNDEGQYSIWPVGGPALRGWFVVGQPKSKAECLSDIEALWTDMRPASLKAHAGANGTT